jgi:hypothetical protein
VLNLSIDNRCTSRKGAEINLVADPVEVLRTWREYGQALGKERPIRQHGRAEPNSDRREGATPRDSDFNDVSARRTGG